MQRPGHQTGASALIAADPRDIASRVRGSRPSWDDGQTQLQKKKPQERPVEKKRGSSKLKSVKPRGARIGGEKEKAQGKITRVQLTSEMKVRRSRWSPERMTGQHQPTRRRRVQSGRCRCLAPAAARAFGEWSGALVCRRMSAHHGRPRCYGPGSLLAGQVSSGREPSEDRRPSAVL